MIFKKRSFIKNEDKLLKEILKSIVLKIDTKEQLTSTGDIIININLFMIDKDNYNKLISEILHD